MTQIHLHARSRSRSDWGNTPSRPRLQFVTPIGVWSLPGFNQGLAEKEGALETAAAPMAEVVKNCLRFMDATSLHQDATKAPSLGRLCVLRASAAIWTGIFQRRDLARQSRNQNDGM